MPTERLLPVLRYLRTVGPDAAAPGDSSLLRRFTATGDEEAFAELVRRHGPMVLGTCRRLLRDPHDADDAFQATFLLLARKASSLRQPDRLAAWLHGVACRVAVKARALAARRRERQQPLIDQAADTPDDLLWRDLRPVLDDAIRALPAPYRAPFVLCYLEGLTNAEAARRLGCPPGTVATRLARARQQLRARLSARGLGPASALTAALLVGRAVRAAVPAALADGVRQTVTGAAPAPAIVTALAKGVGRTMLMERIRLVVLALAAVVTGIGGTGWLTYRAGAEEPMPTAEDRRVVAPPAVAPPTVPAEQAEPVTIRTTNFAVTAPSRRVARLVGEAAERHRKEQARRWLGNELPPWKEPCPVRITLTASGTGGATSFQFAEGKPPTQVMQLEGPLDRLLASALPHEVTHTVLADHFRGPLPRWADEGIAVLSEDEEELQRHEQRAREIVTKGRAIPLPRLLTLREFPTEVMALYAQGASLASFLVKRKDHRTLLRFVADGKAGDWDGAAAKHYGFKDVSDLEISWRAALARVEVPPAPLVPPMGAAPKRHLPDGPAPIVTLAHIDDQGRLSVYLPTTVYVPTVSYASSGKNEAVPVTTYRAETQERPQTFRPADVKASRVDGARIESAELVKWLGTREVPVLVSADGKPVDRRHLRVVKEDTVILIVPKAPEAAPVAR